MVKPRTQAGEDGARAPAFAQPLRILVVDDDRDTVISLLLLLREEGHDVKSAASGEQMWSMLQGFDADVILLDIGLPDRNGYDLAREVRSRFGDKRPAMIAVTAWNKGSDRLLAQLAGFDHHLGKPYEPATLVRLLNSLRPSA